MEYAAMASVNRVTLVGNLGRDPEMRTMPSGDQLANVTIATTDRWKDKNTGEEKSSTEWHRVVFNGRLAEIAGQYLRKGSQIYVEGSLRTRKWTDKDGVEKYSTEIRADQMQMLGSRQGGDQGDSGDGYAPAPRPQQRQAPAPRPAPAMDFPENPSYRAAPRPAPAPSAGSGFDEMGDDEIPFRDPLSYRGAHLVL